ncbi:anti-sigma factor family protein [candidate division KSB1 bacterium]
MKCSKFRNRLTLYVGGDLPEKEMIKLSEHLDKCPDCKAELEKLKSFKETVNDIAQSDIPNPLPSDFTSNVYDRIMENHIKKTIPKRRRWHFAQWKPAVAFGAIAALLLITTGMLYNINKEQKKIAALMYEQVKRIAEKEHSLVRLDDSSIYMKYLEGIHRYDEWKPSGETGIFVILHRKDPANDPYTYNIEFIGESEKILYNRTFLENQSISDLVSRTGSKDNIYIGIYPMPDSSPSERRRIAGALIKKYKPHFNRGI